MYFCSLLPFPSPLSIWTILLNWGGEFGGIKRMTITDSIYRTEVVSMSVGDTSDRRHQEVRGGPHLDQPQQQESHSQRHRALHHRVQWCCQEGLVLLQVNKQFIYFLFQHYFSFYACNISTFSFCCFKSFPKSVLTMKIYLLEYDYWLPFL